MKPSKPKENLLFDYHVLRLIVGGIALTFPWVVSILALQITPSISWSYYTNARNVFVGFLFVIAALLVSYKGRALILDENNVGAFWKFASKFWKGAIRFRIWEGKHEEDLVSTLGGAAAIVTALCPTTFCVTCSLDGTATFHYIGAAVLFSTTVYFCLVAFKGQVDAKIKENPGEGGLAPKELRARIYPVCGWGIAAIMLGLTLVNALKFDAIPNLTFWAEAAALELFGFAWLVASQFLPVITGKAERQRLF